MDKPEDFIKESINAPFYQVEIPTINGDMRKVFVVEKDRYVRAIEAMRLCARRHIVNAKGFLAAVLRELGEDVTKP